MKILVCIKKILKDESDIFIDEKKIEQNCLVYKLNPSDVSAFSEAAKISETHPESVIDVVTVDGAASEPFLKLLASYSGAGSAYRIWDKALGEEDELNNLQVAELLAAFVQKNEYDLILFGSRSEYFGAGGLPVLLSCMLDYPAITNITQVDHSAEGMSIHRMLEKGLRVVYKGDQKLILSFEGDGAGRLEDDVDKQIRSLGMAVNVVSFDELGIKADTIRKQVEKVEYSYPKPRTKYVMVVESASVDDRLGFLMGGGAAKADSGKVKQGSPDKIADEIYKALAKKGVLAAAQ